MSPEDLLQHYMSCPRVCPFCDNKKEYKTQKTFEKHLRSNDHVHVCHNCSHECATAAQLRAHDGNPRCQAKRAILALKFSALEINNVTKSNPLGDEDEPVSSDEFRECIGANSHQTILGFCEFGQVLFLVHEDEDYFVANVDAFDASVVLGLCRQCMSVHQSSPMTAAIKRECADRITSVDALLADPECLCKITASGNTESVVFSPAASQVLIDQLKTRNVDKKVVINQHTYLYEECTFSDDTSAITCSQINATTGFRRAVEIMVTKTPLHIVVSRMVYTEVSADPDQVREELIKCGTHMNGFVIEKAFVVVNPLMRTKQMMIRETLEQMKTPYSINLGFHGTGNGDNGERNDMICGFGSTGSREGMYRSGTDTRPLSYVSKSLLYYSRYHNRSGHSFQKVLPNGNWEFLVYEWVEPEGSTESIIYAKCGNSVVDSQIVLLNDMWIIPKYRVQCSAGLGTVV